MTVRTIFPNESLITVVLRERRSNANLDSVGKSQLSMPSGRIARAAGSTATEERNPIYTKRARTAAQMIQLKMPVFSSALKVLKNLLKVSDSLFLTQCQIQS